MHLFAYERVDDVGRAFGSGQDEQNPADAANRQFIAGGTNLTDYMKLGVTRPDVVVDLNGLGDRLGQIEATGNGIRLGALVRMAEAERHPVVLRDYPVVAQTLKLAASQQIRNMASLAGNVLQRTRCEYFRETSWPCNKRVAGAGCAAMDGVNREHAILGVSDQCIATYPGDFAQALIALDASIEIGSGAGSRTIPFSALHRRPQDRPDLETTLAPGELVTAISIPAGAHTRRSLYVKIRDRQSYQFALASAAIALDLDGDQVRDARIALGGVATVPWRAREAERSLANQRLDEASARRAAEIAFDGAITREHNAYKLALGKQTVVRALLDAKSLQI